MMMYDEILRESLETYKRNRLYDGDMLDDIIDDLHDVVEETTEKWMDDED